MIAAHTHIDTRELKKAEKYSCEMDYILHEYYRYTGEIAADSVDSWIEAVRYVRRSGNPGKKINSLRVPNKMVASR